MAETTLAPDALLDRFSQQRVLVIGDLMLDWFIWGSVARISPEAPVPVAQKEPVPPNRLKKVPFHWTTVVNARDTPPRSWPVSLLMVLATRPVKIWPKCIFNAVWIVV